MAENIHRGIDEDGAPTHEVTDDHVDVPEKSAPDAERLAPVPESTVTVRGNDVGGHCNMTASEYREWSAKRRAKEEAEARVEADAESAANEVRMDAQAEQDQQDADADELADLEAAEAAEDAELEAAEAAELAAAEADNAAEREAEERGQQAKEAADIREREAAEANSNIAPEE